MVSTHQRDDRINRTRLIGFHEALPQGSAFVYFYKKRGCDAYIKAEMDITKRMAFEGSGVDPTPPTAQDDSR
jgi:hypothetical protein